MIEIIIQALKENKALGLKQVMEVADIAETTKAIQTPSALLAYVGDQALTTNALGPTRQQLTRRVAIVLAVASINEQHGSNASVVMEGLRAKVRTHVLAIKLGESHTPLQYDRGRLMEFQNGVLIWQDEYTTTTTIKEA